MMEMTNFVVDEHVIHILNLADKPKTKYDENDKLNAIYVIRMITMCDTLWSIMPISKSCTKEQHAVNRLKLISVIQLRKLRATAYKILLSE